MTLPTEPNWKKCACCHRKFHEDSLEFEYCPECFNIISSNPNQFKAIKVEQRLRHLDFKDDEMREVVYLMWQIFIEMDA